MNKPFIPALRLPHQDKKSTISLALAHTKKRKDYLVLPTITIMATLLFSTFLSPQVAMIGRGLRLALPTFVLLMVATSVFRRDKISSNLSSQFRPLFFGLLYIGYGLAHYMYAPDPVYFQTYILSAAVCFFLWVAILVIRKVFPETLEWIRWMSLFAFAVSLGMGVPLLIRQPGIARLTMGNPLAESYAAVLYIKGVANYSWYTPAAFAWPVIANWLYKSRVRLPIRIIGWLLLTVISISVLLSTFTMAIGLLILGIASWFTILFLFNGKPMLRLIGSMILIAAVFAAPISYNYLLNTDSTLFATTKATQIITGTFSQGILIGDDTGRATRLVATMDAFVKHPILGSWGLETNFYVGGHSSWGDMLALGGLLGLFLWLQFLLPTWFRRKHFLSIPRGMAGGTLSVFLLAIGGILNITLMSQIGWILIWLFDEGGIWREPQTPNKLIRKELYCRKA